jgi:CBS domain-containing protein
MDQTAPIADFMTSMPHTVGSEQTITFAQKLMQKYDIRHLPVLHGGELHGIVPKTRRSSTCFKRCSSTSTARWSWSKA